MYKLLSIFLFIFIGCVPSTSKIAEELVRQSGEVAKTKIETEAEKETTKTRAQRRKRHRHRSKQMR